MIQSTIHTPKVLDTRNPKLSMLLIPKVKGHQIRRLIKSKIPKSSSHKIISSLMAILTITTLVKLKNNACVFRVMFIIIFHSMNNNMVVSKWYKKPKKKCPKTILINKQILLMFIKYLTPHH